MVRSEVLIIKGSLGKLFTQVEERLVGRDPRGRQMVRTLHTAENLDLPPLSRRAYPSERTQTRRH